MHINVETYQSFMTGQLHDAGVDLLCADDETINTHIHIYITHSLYLCVFIYIYIYIYIYMNVHIN